MPRPDTWQKFIAIGALEKEVNVKSLSSGTSVANLRISTESSYKDREGNWKSKKEWHSVAVFGQAADPLAGTPVGTLIFVEGIVETHRFGEGDDKKYVTEVKADRIQVLGSKRSQAADDDFDAQPSRSSASRGSARSAAAPPTSFTARPAPAKNTDPFGDGTGITDDDIPF